GPNPRSRRSRLATGSGGFQWLFSRIGALGGLTLHGSLMERPETLGRLGSLELRLARTAADVRRAQRLRYGIFYEEMSGVPGFVDLMMHRDIDEFDTICDHLLVFDLDSGEQHLAPIVVGTYRLLRQDVAEGHWGFYSSGEYDLKALIERQR